MAVMLFNHYGWVVRDSQRNVQVYLTVVSSVVQANVNIEQAVCRLPDSPLFPVG
jgi:hypothetical protein